MFINNIKVNSKLILMLIVPFLVMLVLSVMEFQSARLKALNASNMGHITNVAITMNRATDAIQREYEISLAFIHSDGKEFSSALDKARQDTDNKVSELRAEFELSDTASYGEDYVHQLEQVNTNIDQLAEIRSAVNSLSVIVAHSYGKIKDDLLKIIEMLPRLSLDKKMANTANAYANLLVLKNNASKEKQILLVVFKRDHFLGREFNDFIQAVNFQHNYESVFLSLANPHEKEFYHKTLDTDVVKLAESMREKAQNPAEDGSINIDPAEWVKAQGEKIELLNKIAELMTEDIKNTVDKAESSAVTTLIIISVVAAVATLLSIIMWWIISSSIKSSLNTVSHILGRIAVGDFSSDIKKTGKDEFGQLLSTLVKMQSGLKKKLDSDAQIAAINARIKVALDNVSANVMLADQNNDIIYINPAAGMMFSSIEKDLAKDIAGFKAGNIIGSNVDVFHKNPAHQQRLLASLSGRHNAQFVAGGRSMAFVANPVLGDEGERLGTVVEWQDRTEEVNAEIEIQSIVDSVQQGDLEQRVSTEGKSGFFLNLSEGINKMVAEVAGTLNDINVVMSALAHGDLTQKIENNYQGTFESVAINVNTTIDELSNIVGEIRSTSDEVTSTSQEILDGNNSLSARTEQQAAALEETASSMEEITSTVKQNSDNAQQANVLSSAAGEMANKGGRVVDDAVVAMQEINVSSEKISEIISVIDEIAFQTNLLALNASVEAARAGEQGRGFAVVATEVRNLAQRSATAAKEIKELINDSVQKVNAGTELVNKSGATLKEIVQGVKKVGDIVAEIAAASQEQTTGIQQVNTAVARMDETTQQNAALAEQTSAASVSMTEQSSDMSRRLEFFTLGGSWKPKAVINTAAKPASKTEVKAVPDSKSKIESKLEQKSKVTPKPKSKPKTEPKVDVVTDASFDEDEWEEF